MKTHGMSNTRLFKCYDSMKYRVKHDPNWAGKGIRVCEEWWNNPQAFFDWALSNGYQDDLTLDRIDTYGNYEPSNCRWITKAEQQRNRTDNQYITISGETKTLAEWSEITGIPYARLHQRVATGCKEEELLRPKWTRHKVDPTKSYSKYRELTINGETKTINEWSEISGIRADTIVQRVKYGWSENELLLKKCKKHSKGVLNG